MSSLFSKPRKQSAKSKKEPPQPRYQPEAATNPFAEDFPHALQVLRLSHEGRGVARTNEGKTVFIEGALPGEWVTYKVRKTLSRYDEAVIDQLLQASPQRQEAFCPHYVSCGGCQLQHLQQDAQLAFKQQLVAELLEYPEADMAAPLTASPFGYRRKARLGIKWRKDGRLLLGFREKNSAFVTATPECKVLMPELQALLPLLYEFLPKLEGRKHLGHLELIQGDQQLGLVVRLLRPWARMSPVDRRLWKNWAEKQQLQLVFQEDQGWVVLDEEAGQPAFSYTLKDLDLEFSVGDFVQVNPEINRQMVDQAMQWLDLKGDERVLDLFCGFGNFSLPLAQKAAQVLAVEGQQEQVARGEHNAERNHLAAKLNFLAADLNQPLKQQPFIDQPWDLVLLDPPRAGADHLCKEIQLLGANKLLYVSCDPNTLARDTKTLQSQGYRLKHLGIMDMFPQTSHVETMALFIAPVDA
ncbi:23S rRNA (uracil1939-C5)-methyltransferase [Marinospirillum celere]|uniref:23S rRNA (uracil(1939)-C(5))-methyltransferase RlmD n=1 Tax=Marinospirillum celere TaxID=1122252 RepID=A0A1I1ETG5_9GAMM|nr:23S rRNA (uracil(1939)-C(5))-methyltransferase RlmD [Marinospirillum celere]SFB90425.1 23S rRNA (uracil1939-C5)-methyltransferase [Marinospirillum celere]